MEKKTIWQAVVCVVLVCLIWGGYFIYMDQLDKQLILVENDFSWMFQVDSVDVQNDELLLTGFAFELNRDAVGDNYEIVLQDLNTEKNIFLKMNYFERKDVNAYFLCEYEYLQSGFEARIKKKKIDLQENDYEVLLRMSGEEKAYRTGIYLAAGEVVYVNPKEFEPLVTEGTNLEGIVREGILKVYCPDYGIYVYQYEGELYWIAEKSYGFDAEGNAFMEYHLNTTQIDNLPKERLENQWYWDNIGFMFKSNEIEPLTTEKYRVAKEVIPVEYSIEKIQIGEYDGQWIWKQVFRPYYQFD